MSAFPEPLVDVHGGQSESIGNYSASLGFQDLRFAPFSFKTLNLPYSFKHTRIA
jgi:hypothetical protein